MAFQVTPSRIFLGLCTGILIGTFFGTSNWFTPWFAWTAAALGMGTVIGSFPLRAVFGSARFFPVLVGLLALGFAVGSLRAYEALRFPALQDVGMFAGTSVVVEGSVVRYPDVRIEDMRFVLDIVRVNEEVQEGRILVFADRSYIPKIGESLLIEGKLKKPEPYEDFNYPAYLAQDGISTLLFAKNVRSLGRMETSWRSTFGDLRSSVDRTSLAVLPYKEGAMLKAILLGDEGSMPEATKESLNRSGLRHIVAISGMNITIIVTILMGAALRIGLWRRQAFAAACVGILGFLALIGFPASAVRAALMGLSIRLAPLVGRQGSGFRAAVAAAAGMIVFSPLTLRYDVGFQLSFLAVVGIIFLGPIFMRWLSRLPWLLRDTLAMTFAAQCAVLPLLAFSFGNVSLISPLSNLFVVPLLPLVTVWGFVAVGLGALFVPFGTIAALPLLPYFAFVGWIAENAAAFPFATVLFPESLLAVLSLAWSGLLVWILLRERRRDISPAVLARQQLRI